MSRRRLLAWIAVYVSGGLALLGFFLFVSGVFIEFFSNRDQPLQDVLSPTMQLSLTGLCLATLMIIFGFVLIGVLLARQAREQAPGYGDAYRFVERFQFSQAIPVLERAIRSGHETPEILMLLTSAYAYTGQIAKAQATADRAVNLFPNEPGAYITLANGYRFQASYEEAAHALEAAIELEPDQPVLWAELGFVHQMAGDEDAAFRAFLRAAEHLMPPMYGVRVYYHLSEAFRKQGNKEQALLSTAKMMSARDGVTAWGALQTALEGTVYGQTLRYELANIAEAIKNTDAARLEPPQ